MEPDISPLAKRLAEENNVNWRNLGGSGSEGRIVERDVLEYLARVMAGDEDTNPTPEPTPEGVDAWPEEDTAGYFNAASSAQSTDTLTEVVDDDPFAEPTVSATAQDDVDISEDIFLFDDDVSEVEENEAFAATFDPDPGEPVGDQAISQATSHEAPTSDPFADDVTADETLPEVATVEADIDAFEMDDIDFGDAAQAPEVEVRFDQASGLESSPSGGETGSSDDNEALFVEESVEAEAEPALFEDSTETFSAVEASEPGDLAAPVSEVEPAAEPEPVPVRTTDSFQDDIAEVTDDIAPAAPVLPSTLPLVSYGVLLRRHADLTALVQAQHSLGSELGQDGPLSLNSLLVRACAKALEGTTFTAGKRIGLARLNGEAVSVSSVSEAHSTPFRDLVQQLNEAHEAQDTDLIVADLSNMGVDEAVLNLDAPVLALGRILHDSEEGTHHSTLTLSGDVPVEAGSKFLSAVADLLGSPIRLVL